MTTRREFVKQAGMLAASAFATPELVARKPYKLGLQLYTLNKEMASDAVGTLRKVASFGYQDLETYSFNYGSRKGYWGYGARELKKILTDNGLTTSSGHYDVDKFILPSHTDDDLKRYVDQCIEGATILGQKYIVWPWLAPEFRTIDKFKVLAQKLNLIGEQIKKAHLQLAYHNHDFEFIEQNGQIGYDIILNETDPELVKMEMDLYWFTHSARTTAMEYFKKYPNRFRIWHIKDMDKMDRNLHTAVGDGSINFRPFFAQASRVGLEYIFVEQGNNYVPNSLTCVEKSARYMLASKMLLVR